MQKAQRGQKEIKRTPEGSRLSGGFLCCTNFTRPTGALDSKAGRELLECLKMVNDRGRATILMVTHDPFCASYAKDVCMLSDGIITCRISRGTDRKEFYDRIVDVQTSMGGDFSCQ